MCSNAVSRLGRDCACGARTSAALYRVYRESWSHSLLKVARSGAAFGTIAANLQTGHNDFKTGALFELCL